MLHVNELSKQVPGQIIIGYHTVTWFVCGFAVQDVQPGHVSPAAPCLTSAGPAGRQLQQAAAAVVCMRRQEQLPARGGSSWQVLGRTVGGEWRPAAWWTISGLD